MVLPLFKTHYSQSKSILTLEKKDSLLPDGPDSVIDICLENGIKELKRKELKIQEEEKKVIQQKKIISAEEYKKKVTGLRSKVSALQKERNTLLSDVSKQRSKAKNELLRNLNPILEKYMKERKIRIVLDKKSILLADENLNITKDIMKILNQKLKSIKLN